MPTKGLSFSVHEAERASVQVVQSQNHHCGLPNSHTLCGFVLTVMFERSNHRLVLALCFHPQSSLNRHVHDVHFLYSYIILSLREASFTRRFYAAL